MKFTIRKYGDQAEDHYLFGLFADDGESLLEGEEFSTQDELIAYLGKIGEALSGLAAASVEENLRKNMELI